MAKLYKRGRPSRKEPPQNAGEYRWVNKETNEIDYLGETNNLKRRKQEHERSLKPVNRKTHFFEWKKADERFSSEKRREHERIKIKQKNPLYNMRNGGGGRKTRKQRTKSYIVHDDFTSTRKNNFISIIFDIIMIAITGGLWIIWMIVRSRKK